MPVVIPLMINMWWKSCFLGETGDLLCDQLRVQCHVLRTSVLVEIIIFCYGKYILALSDYQSILCIHYFVLRKGLCVRLCVHYTYFCESKKHGYGSHYKIIPH